MATKVPVYSALGHNNPVRHESRSEAMRMLDRGEADLYCKFCGRGSETSKCAVHGRSSHEMCLRLREEETLGKRNPPAITAREVQTSLGISPDEREIPEKRQRALKRKIRAWGELNASMWASLTRTADIPERIIVFS